MKTAGYSLLCASLLSILSAGKSPAQHIAFDAIPAGWTVEGKPLTKKSVFTIEDQRLTLRSDRASGTLTSGGALTVDLKKTPVIRWRWRATVLPAGADGRDPAKDDQAVGIYISAGTAFKQQSLAYRWETETPAGTQGKIQYAKIISVRWFALRDKSHADSQTFFIEERNLAEDFKAAFGFVPEQIGIGISCNSQYTGTRSEAQLDWIEFCAPGGI
jgi:hypothetical protein